MSDTAASNPTRDAIAGSNSIEARARIRDVRIALVRVVVLLGLTTWMFWPELVAACRTAAIDRDWVHGLVAPWAVFLLVICRRRELAASLTRGSGWGVVLMLCGMALFAVFTWPFQFGYPCQAAFVPVVAGVILAACGWRTLKRCTPILLLVLLSIPPGARAYQVITQRIDAPTAAAVRWMLDHLPQVESELDGPDLFFTRGGVRGAIALGEPRYGAAMLVTYVVIGVYVTFLRVRPFWQVVVLGVCAIPISLASNFARVLSQGLLVMVRAPDPADDLPRLASGVISLVLAYACFAVTAGVLSRLVIESDDAGLPDVAAAGGST